MFDLGSFTLRDMTELGGILRQLGEGAKTMEEVANRIVHELYEQLRDRESRARSCALLRFFKTHPYGELDAELRAFVAKLVEDAAPSSMKCLTLLASAGERPEWNSRRASAMHKALPLPSEETIAEAPMISRLLQQLGVETGTFLNHGAGILVEPRPSSFNVFYVPTALGSPYIPAQEEFVKAFGIESVLGFGGMLATGDIFAVILFSKVHIPRETAELFRTLALNVKMAVLPFDEAVFAPA